MSTAPIVCVVYCIIQRGVCYLAYNNVIETPVSIMQYSSTAPQTAASKMIIKWNQQLSEDLNKN